MDSYVTLSCNINNKFLDVYIFLLKILQKSDYSAFFIQKRTSNKIKDHLKNISITSSSKII